VSVARVDRAGPGEVALRLDVHVFLSDSSGSRLALVNYTLNVFNLNHFLSIKMRYFKSVYAAPVGRAFTAHTSCP